MARHGIIQSESNHLQRPVFQMWQIATSMEVWKIFLHDSYVLTVVRARAPALPFGDFRLHPGARASRPH